MFSVSSSLKMQPSHRPRVHVIQGDVPSFSDRSKHRCKISMSACELEACRDFPAGHIHFPLQGQLHVACSLFLFCMKSVYSKKKKTPSSRSSSGSRDRVNHACEWAQLRLAGRCQVSLQLWEAWLHAPRQHLHLPNVVQSFLSQSTEGFLFRANKKTSAARYHTTFLFAHCI